MGTSLTRTLRSTRFLVVALPLAALVIGSVLTLLAVNESRGELAAERDRIAKDRAVASVTRRLDEYRETLTSLRGLFLASNEVSRDEFGRFIESGDYLDRVPGIEALIFAPSGRSTDGEETFEITYRRPAAPELLGIDLNAQPTVRARISEARRDGMIVGNPPVELATGGVGLGLYEWVPGPAVVAADCVESASSRCAALRESSGGSLLLGVLRSPDLVDDLKDLNGTTFSIADRGVFGGPPEAPLSVFTDEDATAAIGEPVEIDAFGRRWELTFHSLGSATVPGSPPWLIGLLGMIATLALTVATYAMASARARAEARATQLTAELAGANAQLEESNSDLQAFAFAASHDLQTPVRNVRQLAEILQEDIEAGDLDSLRENVELLGVVGERADELIQGLLSFSRVGSASVGADVVDMHLVVHSARSGLEQEITDAGGDCEVAALPAVVGNETLLRQAVENLLQNAVKYRDPDRALRIRVWGERHDDRAVIHVEDNGMGIDDRFQSKVFEMYQRLGTKGDVGGSGIGLALVKRIVERHGGRVELTSEPGSGSVFSLVLPAAPAADASGGAPDTPGSALGSERSAAP